LQARLVEYPGNMRDLEDLEWVQDIPAFRFFVLSIGRTDLGLANALVTVRAACYVPSVFEKTLSSQHNHLIVPRLVGKPGKYSSLVF
jgi:hypothetical protein